MTFRQPKDASKRAMAAYDAGDIPALEAVAVECEKRYKDLRSVNPHGNVGRHWSQVADSARNLVRALRGEWNNPNMGIRLSDGRIIWGEKS